jgi:MOSC domain-containing protein YiiM
MPFHPASSLAALIAAPVRAGRVEWIGARPAPREPMRAAPVAALAAGRGLVGDRYGNAGGARQVTLIEAESFVAIAGYLGRDAVPADALRRNLVVRGINLLALKGRRFRVGDALLEMSGECHPCSRMEEALGVGGYNAVRGRGGITARVIAGATIRVGDVVAPVADDVSAGGADRPAR